MDDISLVNGIIEGDEKSLRFLVDNYGKRLISYIVRRGVSHEEAMEVVSESLYKIVKKIQLYDPKKGKFSSWIYPIAINTLRDKSKKVDENDAFQSLDERAEKGFQDIGILWEIDEEPESIRIKYSRTLLKDALKQISERDRMILMEWSYGLKHKEIGMILGITENAAKVAYHRALKRLKIAAFHILDSMDDERVENLKLLFHHEEMYERR